MCVLLIALCLGVTDQVAGQTLQLPSPPARVEIRPIILPERIATPLPIHVNTVQEHNAQINNAILQTAAIDAVRLDQSRLVIHPEVKTDMALTVLTLAASRIPIPKTAKSLNMDDAINVGLLAVETQHIVPDYQHEFVGLNAGSLAVGKLVELPLNQYVPPLGTALGTVITATTPVIDTATYVKPEHQNWAFKTERILTGYDPMGTDFWQAHTAATYGGSKPLPYLQHIHEYSTGNINGTSWNMNTETRYNGANWLESGWSSTTASRVMTTPQIPPASQYLQPTFHSQPYLNNHVLQSQIHLQQAQINLNYGRYGQ